MRTSFSSPSKRLNGWFTAAIYVQYPSVVALLRLGVLLGIDGLLVGAFRRLRGVLVWCAAWRVGRSLAVQLEFTKVSRFNRHVSSAYHVLDVLIDSSLLDCACISIY